MHNKTTLEAYRFLASAHAGSTQVKGSDLLLFHVADQHRFESDYPSRDTVLEHALTIFKHAQVQPHPNHNVVLLRVAHAEAEKFNRYVTYGRWDKRSHGKPNQWASGEQKPGWLARLGDRIADNAIIYTGLADPRPNEAMEENARADRHVRSHARDWLRAHLSVMEEPNTIHLVTGPYQEGMMAKIATHIREAFPDDAPPQLGMQVRGRNGEPTFSAHVGPQCAAFARTALAHRATLEENHRRANYW